jgi:geranylgeranyl diphosphate synthase type II
MTTESAKIAYAKEAVQILEPYKARFEKELEEAFTRFGPENQVKEAMKYALRSQGKRFRPALVYMIADALQPDCDVTPAALAVEYFHTASLIADDLPCMDNDDFRRGVPTTHKVYGDATALLASYALIASGFEEIARNKSASDSVNRIAVLEAAKQMGNIGLIGGQCLDLVPKGVTKDDIIEIMQMKTVALFDLALSLGWLFGGGDASKIDLVHKMSFHFGIAFQILDDLDDRQKDSDANRVVNYANLFGTDEAVNAVQEHIKQLFSCLEALNISSKSFEKLSLGLKAFAKQFG